MVAEIRAQQQAGQIHRYRQTQGDGSVPKNLLRHTRQVAGKVLKGVVGGIDRPHQTIHGQNQIGSGGLQALHLTTGLGRIMLDGFAHDRGGVFHQGHTSAQIVVHVTGNAGSVPLNRVGLPDGGDAGPGPASVIAK